MSNMGGMTCLNNSKCGGASRDAGSSGAVSLLPDFKLSLLAVVEAPPRAATLSLSI